MAMIKRVITETMDLITMRLITWVLRGMRINVGYEEER